MLFTRAKAEALLNRTEMGLYDDSRINNLRRLAASEIGQRIERGRRARDRARDLVRRQKLSSRERTGAKRGASGLANQRSKQKAELMADILKRFEGALAPAKKRERELSGRSAVVARKQAVAKTGTTKTAKTPAKRAAAKRAGKLTTARTAKVDVKAKPKKAARRAAATSAPETARTASAAPAKAAASTKPAAAKASASKAPKRVAAKDKPRRALTPKRALAKTRKLLEAKQASDREAKPWQTLDPDRLHVPEPGYQSSAAARNAVALHAAESRMAPIHGSISTRDRRNQGKRDHRGDND